MDPPKPTIPLENLRVSRAALKATAGMNLDRKATRHPNGPKQMWPKETDAALVELCEQYRKRATSIEAALKQLPDTILDLGKTVFYPDEFAAWLTSIEPRLGCSPLDAIANDRVREVFDAIIAVRDGIPY